MKSRLALAAVLTALAAVLAACSVSFGGSHEIDPKKAESFLLANIHPTPKSVTCPSGVKEVKGGTFVCTIVFHDGTKGTVTLHMTDTKGDVHVGTKDIHTS